MDVRTVPAEVQQDGSLSISLEPELIRQMLEQAEEEGAEVTSTDVGLTPEGICPEFRTEGNGRSLQNQIPAEKGSRIQRVGQGKA